MRTNRIIQSLLVAAAGLAAAGARAGQRFPRPDFTTGYMPPLTAVPAPRWPLIEYLDVAVLLAAMAMAAYLALHRRSRKGLLALTVFGLLYFGFWRRGCVCAVGAVQNLALAWFESGYTVPLTVVAFFVLPLLAALLAGRVFCAGVCPLGALQDLLLWRPVKVPAWLNHALGMLPWVYLCLALLFAATGTDFLICRWDPFVGFFRLGAPVPMLAFGALVLGAGLFVGRPYCRYLCPYGVLLGVMSLFARRHLSITPDKCVQCRLCEEACPFGAIVKPLPPTLPEPRRTGVRRLAVLLVLIPLLLPVAAVAGYVSGNWLSRANRDVALALEVSQAEPDRPAASLEWDAFFTSGLPAGELYARARAVQRRFAVGGAGLGALLALVVGVKLLSLSVWRSRRDYEPDRTGCFSCGRCFVYCPVGRRKE